MLSVCILVLTYVIALAQTFDHGLAQCIDANASALAAASKRGPLTPEEIQWQLVGCTQHPLMAIVNTGAFLGVNWVTW